MKVFNSREALELEAWNLIVNRGQSAHIEPGVVGSSHEGEDWLLSGRRVVARAVRGVAA